MLRTTVKPFLRRNFSLALFAVLFSGVLWAKPLGSGGVLIVSDIDDTVKISHVLNFWDSLKNAFAFNSRFQGMSDVYRRLSIQENHQVAYVSNAPKSIMTGAHRRLLKEGWFPSGPVMLRKSLTDDNHKVRSVLKLVHRFDPAVVILIGDNGESDVHHYKKLESLLEGQGREVHQYIHQVYSDEKGEPLNENQTGFVTAVDLSLDLWKKGLVSQEFYDETLSRQLGHLVNESSYTPRTPGYFPNWLDCSDYSWIWGKVGGLTNQVKKKILSRCICESLF